MTKSVFQMLSIKLHCKVENTWSYSVISVSTHTQHRECNSRPDYLSSQSCSLSHPTFFPILKSHLKVTTFVPEKYHENCHLYNSVDHFLSLILLSSCFDVPTIQSSFDCCHK